MNDMTAAHQTLPFGTYVMVTNLDNDRSAVVRINDRGPFVKGRIIDLSYAAARVLGIVGPGTARVRLDVLRGFKAPGMTGGMPAAVWIQVGAFSVQESAYTIMRRLEKDLSRRRRLADQDGERHLLPGPGQDRRSRGQGAGRAPGGRRLSRHHRPGMSPSGRPPGS